MTSWRTSFWAAVTLLNAAVAARFSDWSEYAEDRFHESEHRDMEAR